MKLLHCWRCRTFVPMLEEAEFEAVRAEYLAATKAIKEHRASTGTSLRNVPVGEFYRPMRDLYAHLAREHGMEPSPVPPEHILKHRFGAFGPPCTECGLPLRTPRARICAACGTRKSSLTSA